MNHDNEKKFIFDPLHRVEFFVGNECDIKVIQKEDEKAHLELKGDASFIEFSGIENHAGVLRINIKNPTGSDTNWMPYDRGNYNKHNIITLHTGKKNCNIFVINYLDLHCYESETDDYISQWIFKKDTNHFME